MVHASLRWAALIALSGAHMVASAQNPSVPSVTQAADGACSHLAKFDSPSVEITTAQDQPAGPFTVRGPPGAPPIVIQLPAHCLVTGVIDRRT